MTFNLLRWFYFGRKVGLWHHSEYDPKSLRNASHLIGIDPDRIEHLLERLVDHGIIRRPNLHLSPLIGFDDLRLVHPTQYLEQVTSPKVVSAAFGYEFAPHESDQILRWQRRAVGGTVAAALAVMKGEFDYGVNLGGGFHHATLDKASGFCIFNDIAVAVAKLRKQGMKETIGIVDLDFHQGNGNLAIFSNDPSVATYSIHGTIWDERDAVSDYGYLLPPGTGDQEYLDKLKSTLPGMMKKHSPELIFYIAGNDVLGGDRLGNFSLTPQGVLLRDQFVTKMAKQIGSKMVVLFGGGYSPAAWDSSANFIEYLSTGKAEAEKQWAPPLRSKFSKIRESLQDAEAKEENVEKEDKDEDPFSETDVLGDLGTVVRSRQLLDFYSPTGVEFAFEKYGILEKVRQHGFTDFKFEIDPSDADKQVVRVYARSRFATTPDRQLLLELVVHLLTIQPSEEHLFEEALQFVGVKWLLLQDPESGFSKERPMLPGQEHPGLGIAEDIQEFLVQFCIQTNLDGVFSTPSHYHNAAVASRSFRFLDPLAEGRFLAMRQLLLKFHLYEASSLLEEGGVLGPDKKIVKWQPAEQVLPVSLRLFNYFISQEYRARAQAECQRILSLGYVIDPEKAKKFQTKQFL